MGSDGPQGSRRSVDVVVDGAAHQPATGDEDEQQLLRGGSDFRWVTRLRTLPRRSGRLVQHDHGTITDTFSTVGVTGFTTVTRKFWGAVVAHNGLVVFARRWR
eukprot:3091461-Prymnesium_polylepis.1